MTGTDLVFYSLGNFLILKHNHTIHPIIPIAVTVPTIPITIILNIWATVSSVEIIPKLLIMKRVKGICIKIYKITNILVLRKGLRRDSDLTTHQNIVVYGKAIATNIY